MAGKRKSEDKARKGLLEPLFNHADSQFSPQALYEWLTELKKKNAKDISEASEDQDFFRGGEYVKYMFLFCETFKVPVESKYLAVEIFSRFMVKHITNLFNHVKNFGVHKATEWREIRDRVSRQIVLRMVSCCQIASKVTAHNKVVTAVKARRFMAYHGYEYNMECLLDSEMRVLSTLSFNVALTAPHVYIETLMEILGLSEERLRVQACYNTALQLLDLCYLQRCQLYLSLYTVVARQPQVSPEDKDRFCLLKADKMLLASAIIAASVYAESRTLSDTVIKKLCQITGIPNADILDFSTVIVQMVLAT